MASGIWGWVVGGVLAGIIIGFIVGRKRSKSGADPVATPGTTSSDGGLIAEKEEMKAENIAKLKEFVASSEGKITNDQVQSLLKVSDATAERYLDQVEKEGLIKQVGKEGRYTYYNKV